MNQERFDIEYEGNRILENTRIDGNLKTDKSVYLDGMIQGNVHAGKLVIINKGGKVDGDVDCDELYINGTITGNVCDYRYTRNNAWCNHQERIEIKKASK